MRIVVLTSLICSALAQIVHHALPDAQPFLITHDGDGSFSIKTTVPLAQVHEVVVVDTNTTGNVTYHALFTEEDDDDNTLVWVLAVVVAVTLLYLVTKRNRCDVQPSNQEKGGPSAPELTTSTNKRGWTLLKEVRPDVASV